jgi:hypothetical protein
MTILLGSGWDEGNKQSDSVVAGRAPIFPPIAKNAMVRLEWLEECTGREADFSTTLLR